jgi:hypothetical protein
MAVPLSPKLQEIYEENFKDLDLSHELKSEIYNSLQYAIDSELVDPIRVARTLKAIIAELKYELALMKNRTTHAA